MSLFFSPKKFYITNFGMYISGFGMYVSGFGTCVSNFEMKNSPKGKDFFLVKE